MTPEQQIKNLKHRLELSRKNWVKVGEKALLGDLKPLSVRIAMSKEPMFKVTNNGEGNG